MGLGVLYRTGVLLLLFWRRSTVARGGVGSMLLTDDIAEMKIRLCHILCAGCVGEQHGMRAVRRKRHSFVQNIAGVVPLIGVEGVTVTVS